jgi:hypothetical protein
MLISIQEEDLWGEGGMTVYGSRERHDVSIYHTVSTKLLTMYVY